MKLKHFNTLRFLLLTVFVVEISGCAHTPNKSTLKEKTPSEARTLLKNLPSNEVQINNFEDKLAKVVVTNRQIIFLGEKGRKFPIMLRNITIVNCNGFSVNVYDGRTPSFDLFTNSGNFCAQIADAIYIVKETATDKAINEEVNFERALQSYLNASTKPAISEDVRKFKVQAETSVREKRFGDAAEFYESALNIAPWWPEGHFNRALVLAEVGDFETAAVEMNRYIRLAPDAPNIRAAQDKIYEWESKVPKRSVVQQQRK